jgi:hypothetical protein
MATWNQDKFNATLREYLIYTSRTIPQAINTKAFFIARRAVAETPVASKEDIKAFGKTGRIVGMMINKRRAERGEKGLYGKEMAKMVKTVVAARLRSRAYIKSGWLPAIRALEPLVDMKWRRGAKPNDRTVKRYGAVKGRAIPARPGFEVRAVLENATGVGGTREARHGAALKKFGGPALERAFDFETKSMRDYIEAHMAPDAARFNRKQR